MDPTPELADQLDRDRREAARRMTPGERLLAGAVMFDANVAMMRAGIRLRNPDADDAAIEQMLLNSLRKAWRNGDRR